MIGFLSWLFAYNTTLHSSTKETLFFQMYARDPDIPFEDILTPKWRVPYNVDEQFDAKWRARMSLAYEEVIKKLGHAFHASKKQFDKDKKPHSLEKEIKSISKLVLLSRE